MELTVVILAAGKGSRMNSKMPKVLHQLAGQSMLEHVFSAAEALNPTDIITVIGHGQAQIKEAIPHIQCTWVEQAQQLGTAHAVRQALPHIRTERVLILLGDVPLITPTTLQKFIEATPESALGLLSYHADDATGFGRILRDEHHHITGVVEEKDATDKQRLITEVASGIYLARFDDLKTWLPSIKNDNASQEYYLPDIVPMAVKAGGVLGTILSNPIEALGVNNMRQLAQAERYIQKRYVDALLSQGVTIIDPARLDIRGNVSAGQDVVIDVNVILSGDVALGDNCFIGANSILQDVTMGTGSKIHPNSIVEGAKLATDAQVGPFARIRPGTELGEGAKVGNFVEIKKSQIGAFSKAGHLSYIGDATIGEQVNIGAGTITCNYNGVNKFETIIENGAFIGSNTSLVAPVRVGMSATVGAGTVLTKDAPEEQLTLTRAKQTTLKNWSRPQGADDPEAKEA